MSLIDELPSIFTPYSCPQPASHFCHASRSPSVPPSSSPPIRSLQPPSFSLPMLLPAGCPQQSLLPASTTCPAPPGCLKRAFSFLLSLASYDSVDKTPALGCGVTLGIRLSFHVHDRPRTRASCAPPTPAASFSLCIASPAGVLGPLLTCRSRNAATTTASAAHRLLSCL